MAKIKLLIINIQSVTKRIRNAQGKITEMMMMTKKKIGMMMKTLMSKKKMMMIMIGRMTMKMMTRGEMAGNGSTVTATKLAIKGPFIEFWSFNVNIFSKT